MKYELLQTVNPNDLEELVNKYIDEGWKPQGGVSVFAEPDQRGGTVYTYTQAMVK